MRASCVFFKVGIVFVVTVKGLGHVGKADKPNERGGIAAIRLDSQRRRRAGARFLCSLEQAPSAKLDCNVCASVHPCTANLAFQWSLVSQYGGGRRTSLSAV